MARRACTPRPLGRVADRGQGIPVLRVGAFGRSRDISRAVDRLKVAAERKTPFLLLVGASGAGKSSLARAGLVPRLTTPGVVASVDVWRVARMKPSEGQAGPL